jgi:hypothetical protein
MNGAESGILVLLYALAGVVAALLSIAVASLVSALLLRLAATWLGLGLPRYAIAFRAALTANFITFSLNLLGIGTTVFLSLSRPRGMYSYDVQPAYLISPTYLLLAAVIGLAVTAAILYRMVPNQPTAGRLNFGDAAALSALYAGLCILSCIVLTLLVLIGMATYSWTAAMNGTITY